MNAVEHLVEARLRTAANGFDSKLQPFAENFEKRLLPGLAVDAEHDEIDRHVRLKLRLRQKHVDEFAAVRPARLRLEDEPNRDAAARFVANAVKKRQHRGLGLLLLGRERLLVLLHLRICDRFDAVENDLG